MTRHEPARVAPQRIAKIAKEEEDKKKGQENMLKSKDEQKRLQVVTTPPHTITVLHPSS